MYLTHLGIRIRRDTFHIYLKKWFFWTPKDCCPSRTRAKKTFSSTLNVMISQMVKNECKIRHIGIEVSYKILWLKISKLVLILHYLACFQKGLFGGNFEQNRPWSFRGYPLKFLETKNWSILVWAACVKKNNFISFFSFGQVNYIFHKLSVNTKHVQFRLCMSSW
jgi:hypothetical protein